jgi:hypothetical protein
MHPFPTLGLRALFMLMIIVLVLFSPLGFGGGRPRGPFSD